MTQIQSNVTHPSPLSVVLGAIVGEAIVNAANTTGLGGRGVDSAITAAGGLGMAVERLQFKCVTCAAAHRPNGQCRGVRIPEGKCMWTSAGQPGSDLSCRLVVHAAGPIFSKGDTHIERQEKFLKLRNLYFLVLDQAEEKKVQSIAFSLISANMLRADAELDTVIIIIVDRA